MDSSPTTWDEIDDRLTRFLKDPENTDADDPFLYTQGLRIDAWNQAQRLLAQAHTPRQRSCTLTLDDARTAILPDDFMSLWRIYDADDERWLEQLDNPQPGSIRYSDDDLARFWIWGSELKFEQDYTVTTTDLTMYYWAYWPEVTYEGSNSEGYTVTDGKILVPPWAILPLEHLTAAICLTPGSIESARVRTWNMKIDSGVPTQNSQLEAAKNHLWWWNTIMSMVEPAQWRRGV